MWSRLTRQLIELACEEDLDLAGDITSRRLPNSTADVSGRVVPRQSGIICGLALGPAVCDTFSRRLGRPLTFQVAENGERALRDGDFVAAGTPVATLRGSQEAVFAAERTVLNFLARLSGIATLTWRYVEAAQRANPDVKVLDTRKTVPGWRELDKYAVRTGGGRNHRMGLHDAILVKDNHLAGAAGGTLTELVKSFVGPWAAATQAEAADTLPSEILPAPKFIEVEVDTFEQFTELCKVTGIDIILLDNFMEEQLRAAVEFRNAMSLRGKLALEASGGVKLDNIAEIAATGVDRIAVGALTHSAPGLDLGLDL